MNPFTFSVVVLVCVVLCAEANSFHRARVVRRYEQSAKRMTRQGFIFIPILLAVTIVMWTAGWVLGQRRICGQYGAETGRRCTWTTGSANTRSEQDLVNLDRAMREASK